MRKKPVPFDSPLPFPRPVIESRIAKAAGTFYERIIRRRNQQFDLGRRPVVSVKRPVISVGGIRAGGTGKTPTVMLIAELLESLGYTVALLSRGYKRTGSSPLQFAPEQTPPWELIGDEPAMLRAAFPRLWLGIGADRALNARILENRMPDNSVFLLDDGFQHRSLHRNMDIVCIHESILTDRMLPQGYLREPIDSLERAQILFLICDENRVDKMEPVVTRLSDRFPDVEKFMLVQKRVGWINAQTGEAADTLPFAHPIAICGIARPERFFNQLTAAGIEPIKKILRPDHYHYRDNDFHALRELYSQGLITTEKDAVRLLSVADLPKNMLWYLKVRLQFMENDSSARFHHYIKCLCEGRETPVRK